MNSFIKNYKVPLLFTLLSFALLSLVAIQINWFTTSKKLIEEQFDQKVHLAIGSALSDFNSLHHTELDLNEEEICGENTSYTYITSETKPLSYSNQLELEVSLKNYMSCYGIDEKYSVDIFDDNYTAGSGTYCCSINSLKGNNQDYKLGVSFDSKKNYLFDKMKFIIFSFIAIFILLAGVSFLILSSLVKQKRITDNNVDFFNNTAHELKTPLTSISLALSMLRKRNASLANDKYLEIIKSENSKLTDQIERVLYLSKMESGEYRLKKEALNVKQVLADAVANLQLIIEEKDAKVNLHIDNPDLMIEADYFHLTTAFKNLIDNALKYCESKPIVDVFILELADTIKVTFSDNGVGICRLDQEHIFEKFQRVNTGDIRASNGFGIGLAYVKRVIEMHKGFINVHSELSRGSKFVLTLPYTIQ